MLWLVWACIHGVSANSVTTAGGGGEPKGSRRGVEGGLSCCVASPRLPCDAPEAVPSVLAADLGRIECWSCKEHGLRACLPDNEYDAAGVQILAREYDVREQWVERVEHTKKGNKVERDWDD
jgi:hypothetical protein